MSEEIFNMIGDRVTSYIMFTFANSCMPTLMQSKPSTMVSFHKKYITDNQCFFQILVRELVKFKCKYELLYENESAYYILVYSPDLLQEVLCKNCKNEILKGYGYSEGEQCFERNMMKLKKRYEDFKVNKMEFPHEAGVFLGYPIEDVEQYIKNKGKNYVLCGYWKVYHNVEEANRTFQLYKKQRDDGMKLFYSGRELKELQFSLPCLK